MIIKRPKSRLEYINDLQLAGSHPSSLALSGTGFALDEGEKAYVDGGSTLSFVQGVPKAQQADVLNSTLLAQLAANYAFDREKETIDWYDKYREVLENVGWVIQNFSFSKQEFSGTTVRLDKVALAIIGAAVSGNELAVLTAALKALENSDPDSKQVTLFDDNGSSGEGGNFQLTTATLDPNGNVQMGLGTFYFKTTDHQTRFLFFSWSTKDLNFYAGTQSVILNDEIYSTVRSTIVEKLGDKATKYVADLPLGD